MADARLADTSRRSWRRKFLDAARGVRIAVRGEQNYLVHLTAAAVVVVAGAILDISQLEWCMLSLCIAAVIAAEMFNSALERFARTIARAENQDIRDALDTASGAVLVIVLGAVVVGLIILGPRLVILLFA